MNVFNFFNSFRKKIIFLTCCVCAEEYTKISSPNLVIWIKKVWTKQFIGTEKDLKLSLMSMQVYNVLIIICYHTLTNIGNYGPHIFSLSPF